MCVLFLFAAESNIQLYHRGITSTTQTFRQHEFIKYEFHCLDVPRVGAIAVSDAFDCTFECLSNLLCFSVNLAASKGVHGKLWCELLSSDRHRNSTEFKRNESSHHFAIKVRDRNQSLHLFCPTPLIMNVSMSLLSPSPSSSS